MLYEVITHDGSWTGHWIDWLNARTEKRIRARKKPGNKAFPALAPAPGSYVLEH